jgi:hypothetical protein
MSDTYHLAERKCPYCKHPNKDLAFNDDFDNLNTCEKCHKDFYLIMEIKAMKEEE